MNKKQKHTLMRIFISAILYIVATVVMKVGPGEEFPQYIRIILYMIPYLVIGYDILGKAIWGIRHLQPFDECFLMMVATLAAFAIGEYPEATAVMLFYQVGELFQSYAVGKSRASIAEMMSIAPEYANVEGEDGIEEVDPDEIEVGSIIVIRAGEKIPLDGIVIEGESFVDTAALTGEPVPRKVSVGDAVISGCVNGENLLKVKTTKAYEDSTVARILELVEEAGNKKARLENFITRFARYYTPIVTIAALALAVIPPIILGGGWGNWVHRACIFLIVSCPCALVISVPLGFFGGIGAASRIGVLVKGSNFLEAMADVSTIVFDKTGTLTKGEFKVTQIVPAENVSLSKERILELAAYGEGTSAHPIARSIQEAYGKKISVEDIHEVTEVPGHGLRVTVKGDKLLIGNVLLMQDADLTVPTVEETGTVVYLAVNGTYAGYLIITDEPKEGVSEAIQALKKVGIKKTVMLTGDRKRTAEAIARELGLDEVHAQLLPADKVDKMEAMINAQQSGERLAYVGDGINDAPVLMRADVGIAMGSLGSDAAIEAADIVIMDDDIHKISRVKSIAAFTLRIVKENIAFALAVKFLVIILGALGMATMWEAVFGDVGVTVIAILNSMRTLKRK